MRFEKYGGGSCQPGDIEKHYKVWKGRVLRTGSVDSPTALETALGLNQTASQTSQPGAAAAAAGPPFADGGSGIDGAGPPTADGGGGGGTDAQAIEFKRKTSAMETQIEQLNKGTKS